ncbi:MAG: hypothetical protein K2K36_01300 [Muribaculaceae bacterium]|nr:hypothetical protein [Muribaculaceae bacterium]
MRNRSRITAIIVTLLFHLGIVAALLLTCLRFPPEGVEQWPPVPEHEIVLDPVEELYTSGEFVRTGDNLAEVLPVDEPAPSSEANDVPTQDASDPADAGVPAEPKEIVKSEQPSPMKVEQKEKGPTKAEIEAERQRQEAKKQQQTKKNVNDATARAFGGGKGKSTSGSVEGKSDNGAVAGSPGSGLSGRTLEKWSRVSGTKLGTIVVNVKVNAQGHVTSASYNASRSHGTVASDPAMRSSCVARSRECQFSVKEGAPVQSGTIIWTFE